jgi:hypothetical protein
MKNASASSILLATITSNSVREYSFNNLNILPSGNQPYSKLVVQAYNQYYDNINFEGSVFVDN